MVPSTESFKQVTSAIFVGRKKLLQEFEQFIQHDSSFRLLNIHSQGLGGIGKTQLLLRMQAICASKPKTILYTPTLIDFYHIENRSKLGLMCQSVRQLDVSFSDFEVQVTKYHQTTDVSEREFLFKKIEASFFEEYKAFTEKLALDDKIVVLFFDTYEVLQASTETKESSQFLAWLESSFFPNILQSPQARLVVSGRYPLQKRDEFQPLIHNIELHTLSYDETISFWHECFTTTTCDDLILKMHLDAEAQLRLLHKQANGHPILLALIADWVRYRHIKEPFSLAVILANSKDDKQFEQQLIERIASLKEIDSRAILLMAIAYHRMTPELLSYLTGEPIDECKKVLFERLKPLSFIKYKDENKIVLLHDEMQRLISTYFWKKQDTGGELQRGIAENIVAFYDALLANAGVVAQEREIYYLERLSYLFLADSAKGLEEFCDEFDTAIENGQNDYADLLLREAEQYCLDNPEDVPFPEVLHIRWRRIEYYRNTNRNYEKPLQMAQETLTQYQNREDWIDSELHGHFLRVYGSAAFSLERFPEAIEAFQKAKRIFFDLRKNYWNYRTENLIGYTYYRQGHFTAAEEAMERSREGLYRLLIYGRNLKALEYRQFFQGLQLVLGNLAVVYSYLGRFEMAMRMAEIMLTIARLLPRNNFELARSYATAGHISLLAGDKVSAGRYLIEADTLLKDIDNRALSGRIMPDLAILRYRVDLFAYLLEYYRAKELDAILTEQIGDKGGKQLNQAKNLIENACDILKKPPVIKKELADAYYALGELYMVTPVSEHWEKAEESLFEALKWGEDSSFRYRVADTLESLAALYYFWNGASGISLETKSQNFQKKKDIQKRLEQEKLLDYPEIRGKYTIGLADEQFDRALQLLRSQDQTKLEAAEDLLYKAFADYTVAVKVMQPFNENLFYLGLRVFYNRLKVLVDAEQCGEILKISEYLERLRPLWKEPIKELDDIYRYTIMRLMPIEKIKTEIMPLSKHIQQVLQHGDIGMALLLNACLIGLNRLLSPADNENDEYLEQFLLQLNIQIGYFRALNDEYQVHQVIEIIRKELKHLKDTYLQQAIEGYTDCREGTFLYRRGDYGRLLEIYLQDDLHIWRKRFDEVFPDSRKQAFSLLLTGIDKLNDALQGWELLLTNAQNSHEKSCLESLIQRYSRHLGETEYRLAELLMLNEKFDNYIDTEGEQHYGALYYSKVAIKHIDNTDRYRYYYAIQNYMNALYLSGKYADPEFSKDFTAYKSELDSAQEFPSILGRWQITQGDILFSQYFKRKDEEEGGYHYLIGAERNERKIRIMWRHYVEACNFMAQHISDNFNAAVQILQRRIQLIRDIDSLQSIAEGLSDLWNNYPYLKDKKEELYTLIQFANIRSLMLSLWK